LLAAVFEFFEPPLSLLAIVAPLKTKTEPSTYQPEDNRE
jgi:hypothetical protein